jgi:hypothetical protein
MKWVTRKDVTVDRTACLWLIRRFLDAEAQFLFVAEADVLAAAAREDVVPFDLPHHPELKFTHHAGRSTFEILLREFNLDDPALADLAKIIHGDEQRLASCAPLYDALYGWCRERAK